MFKFGAYHKHMSQVAGCASTLNTGVLNVRVYF